MRTALAVAALAIAISTSQPSLADDSKNRDTMRQAIKDVLVDKAYQPPKFTQKGKKFYITQGKKRSIFAYKPQIEYFTKQPYQGAAFAYYNNSVFILPEGGREIIQSSLKGSVLSVYQMYEQLEREGIKSFESPIMAATFKGVYFAYKGAYSAYYLKQEGKGEVTFYELPLNEFYVPPHKSLITATLTAKSYTRSIVILSSPQLICDVVIVDGITLCYNNLITGGGQK